MKSLKENILGRDNFEQLVSYIVGLINRDSTFKQNCINQMKYELLKINDKTKLKLNESVGNITINGINYEDVHPLLDLFQYLQGLKRMVYILYYIMV